MAPQYDAYLLWVICAECQYACSYCVGGKWRKHAYNNTSGKNIDCQPLLASLDRAGGVFRIGISGGEPLVVPHFLDIVKALTLKHYVDVNTNLAAPSARHFVEEIDPSRITSLLCSLHIDEAERNDTLDFFIENCRIAARRGFPMAIRQVAYLPLLSRREELQKIFSERGLSLLFVPFYGEYKGKMYPYAYTSEELAGFGIAPYFTIHEPKNPCNAGFNMAVILTEGQVIPCHNIATPMGNAFAPGGFTFNKELMKCESKTCTCASYIIDPGLYTKALGERE